MARFPKLARSRQQVTPWLLGVLLVLAYVAWTSFIDGAISLSPPILWEQPLSALLNALPGLLLALTLVALTRRLVLSFWLAWLLQALVYEVNVLKVQNLATPLMPADFRMLGQLEGGGHLLEGYLPHSPWPYLAIVAGLAITVWLFWKEPPVLKPHWWVRLPLGALALGLLVSLIMAMSPWNLVYRPSLGLQPWSAGNTAKRTGLINMLSLFNLRYSAIDRKPDVAKAQQLINRNAQQIVAPPAHVQASSLPDIIIIQSESFVDPGELKGYPAKAFIPELARLEQIGYSGRLHIPTFGGGTIRTEFEVLTGISLRYFPSVQFPYLQFTQSRIPSLPRTLERHGYTTTAVHANRPEFWNRTAAFKALGFQKFISIQDFPDDVTRDGRYVSDKDMTDEILRQLKDQGPPQFIFAISIEAHGPYDYNPGINEKERDAIKLPPDISGQTGLELQNFIYHLRHADQQLGRLADVLARRERPTLLMFFGDHLPALVPAFQADGFNNDKDFFMQTVPWILVQPNAPRKPQELQHLAAWTLPGLLLQRIGIDDEPWFNLTQAVAPELANLTRAPDAPKAEPGAASTTDEDMKNATWLRLDDRLGPLFEALPAAPSTIGATPAEAGLPASAATTMH